MSKDASTGSAQGLEYVGQGKWLEGVPAQDLAADEIESLGLDARALVKSGLYRPKPKPQGERRASRAEASESTPEGGDAE